MTARIGLRDASQPASSLQKGDESGGALFHPTRLDVFRLLVRHESGGLAIGALVEASGLNQSTFSTHLAVLAKAGLVVAEKRGRHQIERARIDALRA